MGRMGRMNFATPKAVTSPPGLYRGVSPPSSGQRLQDSFWWSPIYNKLSANFLIDSIGHHGQHGQNGQNELWYLKAQTYMYILYICLSSRVPKLILPMLLGRMGRMNFGTRKPTH